MLVEANEIATHASIYYHTFVELVYSWITITQLNIEFSAASGIHWTFPVACFASLLLVQIFIILNIDNE